MTRNWMILLPVAALKLDVAICLNSLLLDMSRYGTWMKLIRVTAYVLRAVKLFKTRLKSEETELSAEEMKQAELNCCMWIQEEVYKGDHEQLKAGRTLPSSSRLLKIDPYYDEEA